MLAMVVNVNAGSLTFRGVLATIASKLGSYKEQKPAALNRRNLPSHPFVSSD